VKSGCAVTTVAPLSRCRRVKIFSVFPNGTFFDGWLAYGGKSKFHRLSFSNSGGYPQCSLVQVTEVHFFPLLKSRKEDVLIDKIMLTG
jgi:hypothetical protein